MANPIAAAHAHISRSPGIQGGEPVIKGTRFPVRSVVHRVIYEGETPEELRRQFPRLSLAGIYDALSYYYDHKREVDAFLQQQREEVWKKRIKS